MNVKFCCGNTTDHADDERLDVWDEQNESLDDLSQRAVAWSAPSWPESDGEYDGVVWVIDDSGEILVSMDVTIDKDGELSSCA